MFFAANVTSVGLQNGEPKKWEPQMNSDSRRCVRRYSVFIGVHLWFHSLPVLCAVKMVVQCADSAKSGLLLASIDSLQSTDGQRQNIGAQHAAPALAAELFPVRQLYRANRVTTNVMPPRICS